MASRNDTRSRYAPRDALPIRANSRRLCLGTAFHRTANSWSVGSADRKRGPKETTKDVSRILFGRLGTRRKGSCTFGKQRRYATRPGPTKESELAEARMQLPISKESKGVLSARFRFEASLHGPLLWPNGSFLQLKNRMDWFQPRTFRKF